MMHTLPMLPDELPLALRQLLQPVTWQRDELGQSSARTYRLDGPDDFYLKINAVEPDGGLQTEADSLLWLGRYLPAPDVIFYERIANTDYLLMRALPGLPASDAHWRTDPTRLTQLLANTMRALHNLDWRRCPFDQRTETKLRDVGGRVRQGRVDETDFDQENRGQTPQQLLDWLYTNQPDTDDLVVTHGDFCLPNVLFNDWTLSGLIDVGKLGFGDRYQDLALCVRSLQHNLNTTRYNPLFFQAYGLKAVEEHKLRYFRLLDELM